MSFAPLVVDLFTLKDRVALITGGAGLLGVQHAEVIAAAGGIPILLDLDDARPDAAAQKLAAQFKVNAWGAAVDITDQAALVAFLARVLQRHGRIDILINNAANNPKVESQVGFSRVENFPSRTEGGVSLRAGLRK